MTQRDLEVPLSPVPFSYKIIWFWKKFSIWQYHFYYLLIKEPPALSYSLSNQIFLTLCYFSQALNQFPLLQTLGKRFHFHTQCNPLSLNPERLIQRCIFYEAPFKVCPAAHLMVWIFEQRLLLVLTHIFYDYFSKGHIFFLKEKKGINAGERTLESQLPSSEPEMLRCSRKCWDSAWPDQSYASMLTPNFSFLLREAKCLISFGVLEEEI